MAYCLAKFRSCCWFSDFKNSGSWLYLNAGEYPGYGLQAQQEGGDSLALPECWWISWLWPPGPAGRWWQPGFTWMLVNILAMAPRASRKVVMADSCPVCPLRKLAIICKKYQQVFYGNIYTRNLPSFMFKTNKIVIPITGTGTYPLYQKTF